MLQKILLNVLGVFIVGTAAIAWNIYCTEQKTTAQQSAPERPKTDRRLSAKVKYQCCVLLDELLKFKGTQDFAVYGFSAGGKYKGWLDRVQKLDKGMTSGTPIPYEVKTAPGYMMQCGFEYLKSQGAETTYTKAMMPDIKKAIGFAQFSKRKR